MKKIITLLVFGCAVLSTRAVDVSETLYINRGEFVASDGNAFAYMAFNRTQNFAKENAIIEVGVDDNLELKIINNDTIVHGFNVKNYIGVDSEIQPGDSITVTCSFSSESVFVYYDSYNYPNNVYMGLSGMIVVSDNSFSKFYWNIKEHQQTYNDTIAKGYSVDWQSYYPDYFTINGESAPNINIDTKARVTGSVNETIYLYITNTGQSIHSMHFHGYHLEIMYSSKYTAHVGRSKDTFPIHSLEGLVLKLVPDKTGEYPVHDHNLVTVSGGGIYPMGMFITMLIQ
ncbi:MAG: multicopper oxidase domain-containing protein [Flavobacteriales bacterium]|nr:multicopper oxidase domain-containing protein [Flavobacteriales bacterium]